MHALPALLSSPAMSFSFWSVRPYCFCFHPAFQPPVIPRKPVPMDPNAASFPFADDEHVDEIQENRSCAIFENEECAPRDVRKDSKERSWGLPGKFSQWTDIAGLGVACPTDLSPSGERMQSKLLTNRF